MIVYNKGITERQALIMDILSDFHLHSYFSGDCNVSMEEMIQAGIRKGLLSMCFTEHNDFDFPYTEDMKPDSFILNVDSYLYELVRLRRKYDDKIKILFGIEIGLQPCCTEQNLLLSQSQDFDFIIGSSHLCKGADPYYPSFFEGKNPGECCLSYFEETLDNIKSFSGFDVYGHLDYIARYLPGNAAPYNSMDYQNILEEILKTLIEKGKGIECNTSGLRKSLAAVNPAPEIIKRYKELGGEIITVGSDAHNPEDIASGFDTVAQILKDCGFSYYSTFEKRQPSFHKL